MTWGEILALDEAALNLAIEQHCYGWQWERVGIGRWQGACAGKRPRFTQEVPQHTASWGRTMALAWRFGVTVQVHTPGGGAIVWYQDDEDNGRMLQASNESEGRLAVGRIALWRALQEAHSPTTIMGGPV